MKGSSEVLLLVKSKIGAILSCFYIHLINLSVPLVRGFIFVHIGEFCMYFFDQLLSKMNYHQDQKVKVNINAISFHK